MKNNILFFLLVLIPVCLLTWFAIKAQSNEQLAAQQQYQNLANSQLKLIDEKIISYFQQLENTLITRKDLLERPFLAGKESSPSTTSTIRQFLKYSPYILNIYIADKDHNTIYPSLTHDISEKERQFLANIQIISKNRTLFQNQNEFKTDNAQNNPSQSSQSRFATVSKKLSAIHRVSQNQNNPATQKHGWITWYQERNLHHLFWFKDAQQRLYLLFLDRIRILSELISLLPDEQALSSSPYHSSLKDTTIRLSNSNNELIYEWGDYPVSDAQSIDLMLSYPLSSWKLSWYAKSLSERSFSQKWSLLSIALFASLLMLALIFIIYREYNRQLRQARQRVNFVSQVSHELKTPLTNIRMYAELLEAKIDSSYMPEQSQEQIKSRHFLAVIINESQRLSRLIENVLSFSKVQKQTFNINKTISVIDACIDNVLLSFAPIFMQKGIAIHFTKNAAQPILFDPQLLEQILNNLLSNVEKYAAKGKKIEIHSRQTTNSITIEIRDYGPGIAKSEQKKIFQPFYRSSAKLTEGVSGTGIGLTISQQLAKLHGGSLTCKNTPKGACFIIHLETGIKENS